MIFPKAFRAVSISCSFKSIPEGYLEIVAYGDNSKQSSVNFTNEGSKGETKSSTISKRCVLGISESEAARIPFNIFSPACWQW